MEDRIKEIVMTVLELTEDVELKYNTDLQDLGLDSMTCVELVVNLEDEFGISVDEEDLLVENMTTIAHIEKLVDKYL